jgi:signal transduction histidine kinase
LEDILTSVRDDLKELAIEKKIDLQLILPTKKVAPILTGADFLEQAIYNLVDNAIKYTQKGFVKVELSGDGGELMVKVSDSGIGIPAADQKKMFDKFSRAKNAVNMYTDGTGLGLFIAKQIIEAHDGGSLGFVSKEGEGTTFTIKLKSAK